MSPVWSTLHPSPAAERGRDRRSRHPRKVRLRSCRRAGDGPAPCRTMPGPPRRDHRHGPRHHESGRRSCRTRGPCRPRPRRRRPSRCHPGVRHPRRHACGAPRAPQRRPLRRTTDRHQRRSNRPTRASPACGPHPSRCHRSGSPAAPSGPRWPARCVPCRAGRPRPRSRPLRPGPTRSRRAGRRTTRPASRPGSLPRPATCEGTR